MKKVVLSIVIMVAVVLCMGHGGCRSSRNDKYSWRAYLEGETAELTSRKWVVKEAVAMPGQSLTREFVVFLEISNSPEIQKSIRVKNTQFYDDYMRLKAGDEVKFEREGLSLSHRTDPELVHMNLEDFVRPVLLSK